MPMTVPDEWWREACEVVSHPMAAVQPADNTFIWVNQAFERLVGYSRAELREKTWMSITVQEDVGGDLASVNDLVGGRDQQYTMSKRYRHKFGKLIPIELTVWRFPRDTSDEMVCFIVEAMPESASTLELDELRQKLESGIENLEIRWKLLEEEKKKGVNISMTGTDNSQRADRGGRNTTNSNTVIIAVVIALCIAFTSMTALIVSGKLKITQGGGGTVDIRNEDSGSDE